MSDETTLNKTLFYYPTTEAEESINIIDAENVRIKDIMLTGDDFLYEMDEDEKLIVFVEENIAEQKDIKVDWNAIYVAVVFGEHSTFYDTFLSDDEPVYMPLTTDKSPQHLQKKYGDILLKEEFQKILSLETNIRNRLLLSLAYYAGLRVGEIVSLKKENINISKGYINIISVKDKKIRYIPLSKKIIPLFTEYCSRYDIKTSLFPGRSENSHLTVRMAQKIFTNAIKQAEIDKKLSSNSFRRSFATNLLKNHADLCYAQSVLGHSNLRTTKNYLPAQETSFNKQNFFDNTL